MDPTDDSLILSRGHVSSDGYGTALSRVSGSGNVKNFLTACLGMSEPSLSEKVKDLEKQQQLDKLRLQEGLDEVKAQITQLPHNNLQTQLTNLQTQLSNTQTQLSSLQAPFLTGPEPFATNFQLPVNLSILEHQVCYLVPSI